MIGYLLSRPRIRDWIINRAMRTPDDPIYAGDNSGRVYMARYWLFNPLTKKDNGEWVRKYPLLPFSIRVHNILLPDADRHLHDHPFNARTWIMRGGYEELRAEEVDGYRSFFDEANVVGEMDIRDQYDNEQYIGVLYARPPGSTTTLAHEQFHKITRLYDPVNGAWTCFAFGDYVGPWGFLVDGVKMLHREYIAKFKQQPFAPAKADNALHGDAGM
jgi:hypothetical protein